MLTFEDCLAFSDIDPTDLSSLRKLGTIPALQAVALDSRRRGARVDGAAPADAKRGSQAGTQPSTEVSDERKAQLRRVR